MTTTSGTTDRVQPKDLAATVAALVAAGGRFIFLAATPAPERGTLLQAIVAEPSGQIVIRAAELAAGDDHYPSLTPLVPGAFWYEREIHDLFGLVPDGHPRLDPLVFPVKDTGTDRARPGHPDSDGPVDPDTSALAGHVEGEGVFTIPYGPVRSGVFETVEYLVETFGEDIPRVRVRPYLKHRGIARRFTGMTLLDAVAMAERVEGTMSAAHAAAFCQAVETLAGVEPPPAAQYQRVVHAELERAANHLDSTIRHTEGAGQAVAHARLGWEKERILRLQAQLCGHRFARGVIVPGGTTGPPKVAAADALEQLNTIRTDVARDLRTLMTTPSFLDRLRTTGPITPEEARAHGAVGPVGRASGVGPDARRARAYGAYHNLAFPPLEERSAADALARQWVRVEEISGAFDLAAQALDHLADGPGGPWSVPVPPVEGAGFGMVESPQGELVYLLHCADGRVASAAVRTASFHNFALFSASFKGDIFTDFVFIEASFGVNLAGVAR
jgi:formate hydrogenlyase subunit 5